MTIRLTTADAEYVFASLAELQTFVAALVPFDETYSEWQLTSADAWGACQPDGQQSRAETWTRAVTAPAQWGGASGAPLTETRTGTQACVYVPPPPPPPPPPTSLPFSVNWRDLWPDWTPASLPPQGSWASYEAGQGYAEPRVWHEAQWHDAADGNLEHARHLHVGAWIPKVVTGVFQIDLRILTFHWNGVTMNGLRKNPVRGATGLLKVAPSPVRSDLLGEFRLPLTDHMHKVWLPIRYDPRQMTASGTFGIEFDVDIQRPDNIHHLARLLTFIGFDPQNTGAVTGDGGSVAAEGWMSAFDPVTGAEQNVFGYVHTEVQNWANIPPDYRAPRYETSKYDYFRFKPGVLDPGNVTKGLAMRNPDLHQHPPFYGDVLLPEADSLVAKAIWVTPGRPLKAGDRYVFRTSAQAPNDPRGAAATLVVVGIGKGTV